MHSQISTFALAAILLAGCTFEDGAPWGEVTEIRLVAALDIPAERLDENGLIKTSNSYRVDLASLRVTYAAVSLTQAGGDAVAFDPANPPDGCSLCHNGHCHCDGELVDYADLEVAGGAVAGAEVLALAANGEPTDLQSGTAAITLEDCGIAGCALPRGTITGVRLDAVSATVSLVVSDGLTGDAQRLASPLTVTTSLPSWSVLAPISVPVDRDSARRFRFEIAHRLEPSLFDGVPWDALAADLNTVEATVEAILLDALTAPTTLTLTLF